MQNVLNGRVEAWSVVKTEHPQLFVVVLCETFSPCLREFASFDEGLFQLREDRMMLAGVLEQGRAPDTLPLVLAPAIHGLLEADDLPPEKASADEPVPVVQLEQRLVPPKSLKV